MMRFRLLTFLVGISLCVSIASTQNVSTGQGFSLGAVTIMSDTPAALVTGLPYEAVAQLILTAILPSGNTEMHVSLREYRDSSGRTCIETFSADGGKTPASQPDGVTIIDPAAGFVYVLQPDSHRAYRVAISQLQVAAQLRAPASNSTGISAATPADDVDRYIAGLRKGSVLPSENTKDTSEDLGTQIIAGLVASGERDTRAASDGTNARVIGVSEDWKSKDLLIPMMFKRSNAFGTLDMRVVSIDRSEPDRGLFEVPPDYVLMP
jgi:hypothetical protein